MPESGGAWDDSGTAGGSGLRAPTLDAPGAFVPNEETDNVGIAIEGLGPGDVIDVGQGQLAVRSVIPAGHKVALVGLNDSDGADTLPSSEKPRAEKAPY